MITIYQEKPDGRAGYSFDQFQQRFLEICAEHHEEGRALAFAFLMYDFRTPEIVKMLRDQDYWRALDEISGQRLTVFSFHVREPQDADELEVKWMSPVAIGGDPGKKTQLVLRSYFELSERLTLPAMLFFQTSPDSVIDYRLVRIAARRVEDAFNEIREVLEVAAEAVEKRAEKGDAGGEQLWHAMERSIRRRQLCISVSRGVKALKDVKEAVGFLGLLL